MKKITLMFTALFVLNLSGCAISDDIEMENAGGGFFGLGKEVYFQKKQLAPNKYLVNAQAHTTSTTESELINVFKKKAKQICQNKQPKYTYTIKKSPMVNTIAAGMLVKVETNELVANLSCH